MKRSTISLAAVCFVTMVALAGSANAGGGPGRPGTGSGSGTRQPQQSWKVFAFKNSGALTQQFGHTGKTFNTLPFRYGAGTFKQIGKQFPINGNPERGHGPVVLPTNPITWGGNPPRAPSHGCDHGWDHDCHKHGCGYNLSMMSTGTCNADSYSSDMNASDTAPSDDASQVTADAAQSQDDASQASNSSTTETDDNTPPAGSRPPAPPPLEERPACSELVELG